MSETELTVTYDTIHRFGTEIILLLDRRGVDEKTVRDVQNGFDRLRVAILDHMEEFQGERT